VGFSWASQWPRAIDGTNDAVAPIVTTTLFEASGDHAIAAMPAERDRGDGYAPPSSCSTSISARCSAARSAPIGSLRAEGVDVTARGAHVRVADVELRQDGSLVITPGTVELVGDTLALGAAPRPRWPVPAGVARPTSSATSRVVSSRWRSRTCNSA